MSGVLFKFGSLLLRTAAKPISNYIKTQAREHERFRYYCVHFAQTIHRIDMRLRLGLLTDPAVLDYKIDREARVAELMRKKPASEENIPTVNTEERAAEIKKQREEERARIEERVKKEEKERRENRKKRIRPLSEAKAIETGANFLSEAFTFTIGAGIILVETWRSRRKEGTRRDVLEDRLGTLEGQAEESEREVRRLEKEIVFLRAREVEHEHAVDAIKTDANSSMVKEHESRQKTES